MNMRFCDYPVIFKDVYIFLHKLTIAWPMATSKKPTPSKANQTQTKPKKILPTYPTPNSTPTQPQPTKSNSTFKYSDSEARYSVSSITRSLRVLIFPSGTMFFPWVPRSPKQRGPKKKAPKGNQNSQKQTWERQIDILFFVVERG